MSIVDNCVLENDVHAHGANCINCPLSFDLLFCVLVLLIGSGKGWQGQYVYMGSLI